MKYKTYTFTDPTGSGEDVTVKAPEWFVPLTVTGYDPEGNRIDFDEIEEDAEDERD